MKFNSLKAKSHWCLTQVSRSSLKSKNNTRITPRPYLDRRAPFMFRCNTFMQIATSFVTQGDIYQVFRTPTALILTNNIVTSESKMSNISTITSLPLETAPKSSTKMTKPCELLNVGIFHISISH